MPRLQPLEHKPVDKIKNLLDKIYTKDKPETFGRAVTLKPIGTNSKILKTVKTNVAERKRRDYMIANGYNPDMPRVFTPGS